VIRTLLLSSALVLFPAAVKADCDAAVLSAIDSSVSVDHRELSVQVQGMAFAIRSPELLATIQRGRAGCITMAAFVWGSSQPVVILPWTTISSEAEAEAAAQALLTIAESLADNPAGMATDTSSALTFAYQMFAATNVMTGRQIVNILTDDTPNTNPQNVPAARAALLSAGAQINGVSVSNDPKVTDFLSSQVVGGRGAFVMVIGEAENMAAAMVSKFRLEIAMAQQQ
jgi:Ca-activated chloride channel family protein